MLATVLASTALFGARTGTVAPAARRALPSAAARCASVAMDGALPDGARASHFFAAPGASFEGLGLDPSVVAAARRAGFETPSQMQQRAIPELLDVRSDGRAHDALVTGETGTGKTLAYLLPVLHHLLRAPAAGARALVMLPSPVLCEQVLEVARSIVREDGTPLVRAELAGLAEPPLAMPGNEASRAPALLVCTPTGLVDHLDVHYASASHRRWLVRHLAHIVLDEADVLLSSGYDAALRSTLSLLVHGRSNHPMLSKVHASSSQQRHLYSLISALGRGEAMCRPQLVFAAATMPAGNSARTPGSMLRAALPRARWLATEGVHRSVASVAFEWRELELGAAPRRTAGARGGRARAPEPRAQPGADEEDEPPDEERASMLPAALRAAVADAVRTHARGGSCALVFCNKAAHADALAASLRVDGLRAGAYHRAVPRDEREQLLGALQVAPGGGPEPQAGAEGAQPGLTLVCTDAAARGLDLRGVAHVIHAEFAPNAVSFLHRSGRTGRAGRAGVVTCFYTRAERELAETLRSAVEAGAPLEPVFSRRRSFRKRINQAHARRGGAAESGGPTPAEPTSASSRGAGRRDAVEGVGR